MITLADIELVTDAAILLDEEALVLRQCHCKPPAYTDWEGDNNAQASHDRMKALVEQLHDLADRLRAENRADICTARAMCEALNTGDGVYRP